MASKITNRFDYQIYTTNKVNNLRYYCLSENINVPSVTSILRSTGSRPNSKQTKKVTYPMEIGDMMHQYLQQYLKGESNMTINSSQASLAESLGKIVIENLINGLDEIWGSEVSVHYKDEYAGTIDLIGLLDNKVCIIDYKSSYRTKTISELEDYFLQCAAYVIAHDWQYDTNIDSIMIFQVTRSGEYEMNLIDGDELIIYKEKWLKRLTVFYDKISNVENYT
ncbi:MAG: hypothetical protein CMD82_03455 [Gammaproteobacteria bacterium]|nr:hypothetical protein [Gammaproteobacteria bacterium]